MNAIRKPVRVRHEATRRLLQVSQVEDLTPRMRRVTLAGEALDGFLSAAPDDHVKLFFPQPGAERPAMPPPDAGPDAPRPAMRDYTPRRFDIERRELVIDFVIHGEGPASTWAAQAQPGQWLGVGGPRGSFLTPRDYGTYLLAGDETALPAIARALEEMPDGAQVLAFIEVADGREERHLSAPSRSSITWLHRDGLPAGRATLLLEAIQSLTFTPGETHAWLAAEIETVRALRACLLTAGLPRSDIRAAGYWRLGEAGAHTRLDD